jgi:hypothetical protein
MNKLIPILVSKIQTRCSHIKEMLDFIQMDGHMSKRAKELQKQGINSIQGTARVFEYRDLIMQYQLMLVVADYTLCKHPLARRRYNKLLNRVYKYLNEAEQQSKEKTVDDREEK